MMSNYKELDIEKEKKCSILKLSSKKGQINTLTKYKILNKDLLFDCK